MERIFMKFLLHAFLVHACLSVELTLENGQRGTANKEIERGKSVTLACSATPTKQAGEETLEWTFSKDPVSAGTHYFLNGKIVSEQSDKASLDRPMNLVLKDVQTADTGFYKCRVVISGDMPSVGEGTYNFTVLVPPYPDISCGFPGDLKITIGQSAEFQCREKVAQAVPPPIYYWYKNDVLLPEKPTGSQFANASFSYSRAIGRLVFSKVTKGDAGKYYCEVKNKVGEATCPAATVTTKEKNVGAIVGIVFGVIFALLLIAVLVWWTWKKGYCDGFFESKEPEDEGPDDGANDIMLDGAGPLVTKEPSEWSNGTSNKQEASMMI